MAKNCCEIGYLGYPNINKIEKLKHVRERANPKDWSQELTDEQLLKIMNDYILESQVMQLQCKKNKLPFFDTGVEFEKTIQKSFEYFTKES